MIEIALLGADEEPTGTYDMENPRDAMKLIHAHLLAIMPHIPHTAVAMAQGSFEYQGKTWKNAVLFVAMPSVHRVMELMDKDNNIEEFHQHGKLLCAVTGMTPEEIVALKPDSMKSVFPNQINMRMQ